MTMPQLAPSPEELLRGHAPAVQATAERLRAIILDAAPELTEKAYAGWHGIGYTHPQAGYVCAIFLHADNVRLGFEHGASLYDPDGLLKPGASQGKRVRYLELNSAEAIRDDVIVGFLVEAIRLKA
jgi:hypothetical protein